MNCAVSRLLVFRGGMVDPGRVLLDLEIFSDQRRCQETVNVIVSVENEPGAGEIVSVKLQRLCARFAHLGQAAPHALDPFSAALN